MKLVCLDVAFYGIQLNQSIVLAAVGFGVGASPFQDLWNRAIGNMCIAMLGTGNGFCIFSS
jgi:MFS transporter, PHS family, inorganic phosphate transporter